MATITEQDIINHLKEKISFHQHEAQRLQNALDAFTGPVATENKATTATKTPATKAPVKKASAAGAPENNEQNPNLAVSFQVPAKYTDSLSLEEKIAFALNEIGSGFSEDIANTMAQYEPKSDAKAISRQISSLLPELKNAGKIKTEKEGRKEKYLLAVN